MILAKLQKYGIMIVIFVGLIGTIAYITSLNKVIKADNEILKRNLVNTKFEVIQRTAKNGDLVHTVSALELTNKELKKYNSELVDKFKNIKVNPKNVLASTEMVVGYSVNIDTIVTKRDTTTKDIYDFSQKDNFYSLQGKINVKNYPQKSPYLSDVKIKVTDSLMYVAEKIYKRTWIFCKKPIGIKVHTKSESPYFELNSIKTYYLRK